MILYAVLALSPFAVSAQGYGGTVIGGYARKEVSIKPLDTATVFTYQLSVGSRGDDVTALQIRLKNEGVYKGPVTGYFGPLTKAAVMLYQDVHKLAKNGSLDSTTIAQLNKRSPTPMVIYTDTARTALVKDISNAIKSLMSILSGLIASR